MELAQLSIQAFFIRWYPFDGLARWTAHKKDGHSASSGRSGFARRTAYPRTVSNRYSRVGDEFRQYSRWGQRFLVHHSELILSSVEPLNSFLLIASWRWKRGVVIPLCSGNVRRGHADVDEIGSIILIAHEEDVR
jgi:hypothetical protein